jgi:hypothetical protein
MISDDNQNTVPILHEGEVNRPSTDEAYIRRKLAEFALGGDDGSAATGWAAAHHDTLNACDRAVAEEQLSILQKDKAARSALISRYEDERGAAPLVQRVVTNEKVAQRNGADRATAWSGLAWVMLLKAAEAFLVSRYIINSGVFGLNPSNALHTVFAGTYAILPLGVGLGWCLYLARLNGRAQVEACAQLHSKMLFWIPVWVLIFALVIGPYMLTIVPVDGPYDVTALWVTTTKGFFAGLQDILQAAAGLTLIGLLISSLIATSAIIASKLVNIHQTNTAAHITHVRKDQDFGWHSDELIKLRNESFAAALIIGRLQGFLNSIDRDHSRFVAESQTAVQAYKHQGQMAAGKAILDFADDGNVIPISGTR